MVESVYTLSAAGDVEGFTALMAPDIVWNEADGNPYADLNPYIGPEALQGLSPEERIEHRLKLIEKWRDTQ